MYKAALMLCGDRHVAEDATQEALARALERWDRIGGEPWALGWVMTTALNLVRRTHGRFARFAAKPAWTEPDADTSLDLWKGVRSLP